MINDGYSRHVLLGSGEREFNVWYRPAVRNDVLAFRRTVSKLNRAASEMITYEFVGSRIVVSDIPNTQMSPWRQMKLFDENYPKLFEKLLAVVEGVLPDSSGETWTIIEEAWKQNLRDGINLLRTNLSIAKRSCSDCQKYWYKADGTILIENSTGKKKLREDVPPCRTNIGCPKGTPENQKTLNAANTLAVQHYLECDATGLFPDDQIVKSNAVVIAKALKRAAKK